MCVCVSVSPVIISAPSDETVTEGQTVTLHCQTTAVPPVAVVWRHNTQPVNEDHRTHVTGMSLVVVVVVVVTVVIVVVVFIVVVIVIIVVVVVVVVIAIVVVVIVVVVVCLLYTSPSPRDGLLSRMPSSA